ncbi:MAG: transcriptional regulator [Candidatus Freyarchaeota archaeon]|nr:helix-turn-helix domain-containing protein [Candidatus Freyrarchaeum guaymaensis]
MKLPCEIVIWYFLPSIRSALAKELAKLGFSQKEISERLGLSEAAVSQYMKGKRGRKIEFNEPTFNELIQKAAEKIASTSSPIDVYRETCKLCLELRKREVLCNLHRQLDNVPEDCKLCPGIEKT